jgi:hypothetical protein
MAPLTAQPTVVHARRPRPTPPSLPGASDRQVLLVALGSVARPLTRQGLALHSGLPFARTTAALRGLLESRRVEICPPAEAELAAGYLRAYRLAPIAGVKS